MDDALPLPEKFGRYEIKGELGRGGMATVYLAFDPQFKREVALKVLPSQFVNEEAFRQRFRREAETVAALEHHAIVPVYDFGEVERQPFLVMRLMTGGSLADRLQKGPLLWPEVVRILERLGAALDRAHALGVFHRDIKPENILFDQYGDAFLADFGIARLAESNATLTGSGLIGTPAYMSPEQIEGKPVDGRTDIYALGIILFEMLTGEKPYKADTPAMVLVKQMTEPVPRILDLQPDLPPLCETAIARAMAKDPAQRFDTASSLSQTLKGTGKVEPPAAAQVVAEKPPEAPPTPIEAAVSPPAEAFTAVYPESAGTDVEVSGPQAEPEQAGNRRGCRRWLKWLLIIVAVIFVLIGCIFIFSLVVEIGQLAGTTGETAVEDEDTGGRIDGEGLPAISLAELQPLERYGRGTVDSVALSPDGERVAIGGSLGIWIYAAESFETALLLQGHRGVVTALSWSPDGNGLASASADGTIRIWNVDAQTQILMLEGVEEYLSVDWSPDGQFLAASTWGNWVEIWDVPEGRKIADLEGHQGSIMRVAWSPDGEMLASAADDGRVIVYRRFDEADFALDLDVVGHDGATICLYWFWAEEWGQLLATCGTEDGVVRIWDGHGIEPVAELSGHEYGVFDITILGGGTELVSAAGDGQLRVWEVGSWRQLDKINGLNNEIIALQSVPERDWLFLASWDGTMELRRGPEELIHAYAGEHVDNYWGLNWSPDGRSFTSANTHPAFQIWDTGGERAPFYFGPDGEIYHLFTVEWSPDGDWIATMWDQPGLIIFNAGSMEKEHYPMDYTGLVMDWSPESDRFVIGDDQGRLHVVNASALDQELVVETESGPITAVAWSPNGVEIAVGSDDGRLFILEIAAEPEISPLRRHEDWVSDLAWSPDGELLASSSFDHSVQVWDVAAEEIVAEYWEHDELVTAVDWSPDGEFVVSAGWDQAIRIWDPRTAEEKGALFGHVGPVQDVRWSPDGRRLLSSALDGSILMWGLP